MLLCVWQCADFVKNRFTFLGNFTPTNWWLVLIELQVAYVRVG